MNLDDFKNLDFGDIRSWPISVKLVGVALVCVAILGAGYYFLIKDDRAQLAREQQEEQDLRQTFLGKKALAVNLPAYRAQMVEMQESFGVLLRQLPDKTEIPELLVDITQAGLARGLEFKLFKPGNKSVEDFYATLPISVEVVGTYHEFAEFVSDLAALPRIVSIGNISIAPVDPRKADKENISPGKLIITASARTYHYLDEDEIAAASAEDDTQRRGARARR